MIKNENSTFKFETTTHKLAMWDITYYCNLSCKHCYNSENVLGNNKNQIATMEQLNYIVSEIKELGFNEINLAGGEPLTYPVIFELVERIRLEGIIPSINTNGLLLRKKTVDEFISLGFTNFSISLAGVSEQTNSTIRGNDYFKVVLRNIRYLVDQISKKGLLNNVSINFSVSRFNISDLPNLYEFCIGLGVQNINVHLIQPMGSAVNNIEIIEFESKRILLGYEQLITSWGPDVNLTLDTRPIAAEYLNNKYYLTPKKTYFDCPAGKRNIYLKPDGEILLCKLMSTSNKSFSNKQQLNKTLYNKKSFLQMTKREFPKKPFICSTCKHTNKCDPCPILTHGDLIPECETAMQFSEQFELEVLKKRIRISRGSQIIIRNDNEQIILNGERKFRLSGSGFFIWQLLQDDVMIVDLIGLILSKISDISQQEIVEFIYHLRKLRLIFFDSDPLSPLPITCTLICCAR